MRQTRHRFSRPLRLFRAILPIYILEYVERFVPNSLLPDSLFSDRECKIRQLSSKRRSRDSLMSLFDAILGAVNNPNQQASVSQLGNLVGMVQQVSGENGMDAATTQSVMSMVGNAVQSGLQNHSQANGIDATQTLVDQLSGGNTSQNAIASLIPLDLQRQVSSAIASQTGLDAGMIQSMLPSLIPVVLGMLQSGAPQNGAQEAGSNPLLNMFLDGNHDGNLDVGDAMGLAMKFMQNR